MAAKATFDADFGQFISELTKVDVKLRQFQPEADKASAKLQRMADSLNGNKLLEQAAVAVNAIRRIDGGVAALNNGELRRYGTLIDAATEKLTRMGRDVPPAMAQVKAALDQVRQQAESTDRAASSLGGNLGSLGQSIAGGLGVGAGLSIFGVIESGIGLIKDQLTDVITLGDESARIGKGFTVLQGGVDNADASLNKLRSSTRGMVTDTNLMLAANQASILKLNELGVETSDVAKIATRLGAALGRDATTSINDMTTALARGSFEILDNLGISLRLSEAYAAFAPRIGKTADQLTDLEKKQAFATIAMERGRDVVAKLGEDSLTAGQQVDRISVAWDNLKATIGAGGTGGGAAADFLGGIADAAHDVVTEVNEAKKVLGELRQLVPSGGAGGFGAGDAGRAFASGLFANIVEPNRAFIASLRQQLDNAQSLGLVDIPLPAGIGKPFNLGAQAAATPRTTFSEKELEQAQRVVDRQLADAKEQNQRLKRIVDEREQLIDRLTGRGKVKSVQQEIAVLFGKGGIGLTALDDKAVLDVFDKLFDAREIAKRVEPGAVQGITAALGKVAKHPAIEAATRDVSRKLFEKMLGPEAIRSAKNSLAGQSGAELLDAIFGTAGDFIESRNPLNAVLSLAPKVESSLGKVKKSTDDWRTSLQNVSQAWANLSQVMGDTFGKFNQTIGTIFSAANAAQELVKSIGELVKDPKFASSDGGKALAGGLAGISAGAQLAAFGDGDLAGSFLAGGVGGAVAGGLAAGPIGAAAGFALGGVTALIAANAQQKALTAEIARNREALIAQYGTREELIEQARRVGFSEHALHFEILNNTDDAETYADAVTALSAAFTREQREAEKLAKSLGNVAKVNGVLSQQQLTDVRNALFRPGGEVVTPDPGGGRVRNPGTISGAPDDPGGPRGGPLQEAAEGFLRQQGQSLIAGLSRILEQDGTLSKSLVKAVGQSFPAALAELERQGLSSLDALRVLEPLLDKFREKAVLAGAGSTPGFDALNNQLALLKDKNLGPLIERANGAGQALGALQNLGLLNQETFSGFAGSITESVAGLDLLSDKGQNAMRLIRQPLQNIWQLQQDFGYEVDASTQALLDQAEASGLIGDKFRPAEERMVQGIQTIVDRLDKLIDGFTNGFPDAAVEGAERAKRGIKNSLDNFTPVVRVKYEYEDPPKPPTEREPPPNPPPLDPDRTYPEDPRPDDPPLPPEDPRQRNPGTSSLRTIQAATAPTGRVGVYIDGRLSGEAILPHLGPILEFNGVQRVNA
jgi:hypothetical protein